MDNRHLYKPDWDKVLGVLNEELPEATLLTSDELLLLDELKAIKASSQVYSDTEFDAELKISAIKQRLNFQEEIQGETKKLWPKILIAAAVATIMVTAGILFFNNSRQEINPNQTLVNDIKPGKQGATLTLSSGRKIELSDLKSGVVIGKDLKYKDGTAIFGNPDLRQDDVLELTASTAKGQTYQFQLPDGTNVWLNADSKISFPSQFTGADRKVVMTGEGYFEVTKDKAHPFIVQTDKQVVEVLGTHFNINSYADEQETKTVLLEGSVKINDRTVIKPGEEASSITISGVKVMPVDVEKVIAWKNGRFMFDDEPLESIMRKLARWYNVEVIYQDDVRNILFTTYVSKHDNISKILDKLTYTQNIHFEVKGRSITIMK